MGTYIIHTGTLVYNTYYQHLEGHLLMGTYIIYVLLPTYEDMKCFFWAFTRTFPKYRALRRTFMLQIGTYEYII